MFFSRRKSKQLRDGLQTAKYDENTRRTMVYNIDGIKNYYKGIYRINDSSKDKVNLELLSELYLSRIAKEYFGFKTPIYNVAKYQCLDKSICVGVSSKDFTIGYDMVQDMYSLSGRLLPTLKKLRDEGIYEKLPENIKEHLTYSMLFELITMQFDMSGVNLSFGYSGSNIKDLILYDYGSNSISRFEKIPTIKQIDEKIELDGRLCFGLDTSICKYEDMLDELTYSKNISGKYIENFLNKFGNLGKQNEIIGQVGSDVKTMDCIYSPEYEDILSYSMNKMTTLLEKAYNARQKIVKEDDENVL